VQNCCFSIGEKQRIFSPSFFYKRPGSLPCRLCKRVLEKLYRLAKVHACSRRQITNRRTELATDNSSAVRADSRRTLNPLTLGFIQHHPTRPTNIIQHTSLEWSPDSVWDHPVHQRSLYQRPEDRHWATVRFCGCHSLPSTVTAATNLHSFRPAWKLIYLPHLSRHLSDIICILS